MGPVSEYNLKIAPASYITQVHLTGPFKAYSKHNKIWLVVFCCATTTTINIKVMEDYNTTAFIQAFTRFSCKVGYPKKLIPDEESQLIKGDTSMKLDIRDIKCRLTQNVKTDSDRHVQLVGIIHMAKSNVKYKELRSRSRRPC